MLADLALDVLFDLVISPANDDVVYMSRNAQSQRRQTLARFKSATRQHIHSLIHSEGCVCLSGVRQVRVKLERAVPNPTPWPHGTAVSLPSAEEQIRFLLTD